MMSTTLCRTAVLLVSAALSTIASTRAEAQQGEGTVQAESPTRRSPPFRPMTLHINGTRLGAYSMLAVSTQSRAFPPVHIW